MPIFKTCCGSVNLGRGCMWIGATELFMNSVILFGLVNFHIARYIIVQDDSLQIVEITEDTDVERLEAAKRDMHRMNTFMLLYTVMKCLTLISSIFLIMGSQNRKKCWLIPYLVVGLINMIFSIITLIFGALLVPNPEHSLYIFFYYIFLTCVFVYLWLCVISFYQEIRDQDNQTQPSVFYTTPGYVQPPSYSTFAPQHSNNLGNEYTMIYNTEATTLAPPVYSPITATAPPLLASEYSNQHPIPDIGKNGNTYKSFEENIPKSHYGLAHSTVTSMGNSGMGTKHEMSPICPHRANVEGQ